MNWTLARRAGRLNPSVIREILKVTEQPGIVSLAGGLPLAEVFPVEAMREATARVLAEAPREALQYAASEGYGPLREWVAASLQAQGMPVQARQVLITNGSQQGLDLLGKVLIDPGARVAVESPTYLGALQAFAPYEPQFEALGGDDDGPDPSALADAAGARFAYLLPNFQNPSGRCLGEGRRAALVDTALRVGLPLVEDNPYGELWFDAPPPPSLCARVWGAGADTAVYLGSFSKVLVPGLRLGYVVAPAALFGKLLQAKQAADLHTPGFNQRIVHALLQQGILDTHLPLLRAKYRAQRDALQAALQRHLGGRAAWQVPRGGMFFWLRVPQVDAGALLLAAVARGVAFVPGAPFYCAQPRHDTLRLSFVTVTPERIEQGVAALAAALDEMPR